jgi:hypothetical protein
MSDKLPACRFLWLLRPRVARRCPTSCQLVVSCGYLGLGWFAEPSTFELSYALSKQAAFHSCPYSGSSLSHRQAGSLSDIVS